MWMLKLFGWGIFPHTGSLPAARSHQSRLTGHCLYSIAGLPALKKKNTQATDVQPETMHPHKILPFPLPHSLLIGHHVTQSARVPPGLSFPGTNKSVQLPSIHRGPFCYSRKWTWAALPGKRRNQSPEISPNRLDQYPWPFGYWCLFFLLCKCSYTTTTWSTSPTYKHLN